ncbi:SMC-Scp complex subunit ScpB [Candidatus Aenigmatarchaeota archaeon]
MKDTQRVALLEAILFTTHEPLSIERLSKLTKMKDSRILHFLRIVEDNLEKADHGIRLSSIGGYKLVVKDQYTNFVTSLTPHSDMSRGILRVLSIVAFHEPVEQSEIVKVVGNRTYEYVKELRERGLIKEEKKGRTKLLSTTPHFEEYFNVNKEELKKELKQIDDEKKDNKLKDVKE